MSNRFARILIAAVAAISVLALAGVAGAKTGGVSGPAFYVDGDLYRTVGTPTDLSGTGAPDHSFDTIYEFRGVQPNVATAAPGDRDYNGGRWRVHGLTFADYDGALADDTVDLNQNDVLDSTEEVEAAIDQGYATDDGVIRSFVCPVIPLPRGGGHS